MYEIDYELLLKYIREKDLSYVDLANAAHISRTSLYNVIDGKNCPSHYVAVNLIEALGLTLEDTAAIFYPNIKFKKEIGHEQFTY